MELVGLPGTLSGLLDVGAQKIGLMPENMPPSPVFSALSGAGLRSGASALTGTRAQGGEGTMCSDAGPPAISSRPCPSTATLRG